MSLWARQDSNLRPTGYEPAALTTELRAPSNIIVASYRFMWRVCASNVCCISMPVLLNIQPLNQIQDLSLTAGIGSRRTSPAASNRSIYSRVSQ